MVRRRAFGAAGQRILPDQPKSMNHTSAAARLGVAADVPDPHVAIISQKHRAAVKRSVDRVVVRRHG